MTCGSATSGSIVPPARQGHRRKYSEAGKRQIVDETVLPGATLSEVARRYGIAARVVFRWKQQMAAAPVFVAVQITDAGGPPAAAPADQEHAP